jgi:hypothetical protein
MFPSFPHYKEGTGGRGQIEPGPPVVGMECSRIPQCFDWKQDKFFAVPQEASAFWYNVGLEFTEFKIKTWQK